jgi:hypothetical protein
MSADKWKLSSANTPVSLWPVLTHCILLLLLLLHSRYLGKALR